MTRRGQLMGGLVLVGLLAAALPVRAAGIKDFKLVQAVPANAMIAVHSRDHAGCKFVNDQMERVWDAVRKQGFERDIQRLLEGAAQQSGQDAATVEEQWKLISDLAASVEWSELAQQEFAFAMTVAFPTGAEVVILMIPADGKAESAFQSLAALMKQLADMAPAGTLVLSTEGTGETAMHRVSVANMVPPVSVTLARHRDVLLFGFGGTMVEQSLALLRGQSDAGGATLASTERFQQAFKRLPDPRDELWFVDIASLMTQARQFAQMVVGMSQMATTQPAEPSPVAFLPTLIEELDLWETAAGVSATDGMKTTSEEIAVLRPAAEGQVLRKTLYGGEPLQSPLRYVPKESTGVSVMAGMDLSALYDGITAFIKKHAPNGADMLTEWAAVQKEAGFSVQDDFLSWFGGGITNFTVTRKSAYNPEWAYILKVKDEEKANTALNKAFEMLSASMAEQGGGVEDARLDEAEGFRVIILPPFVAMMIGQPVVGVRDKQLFIGNSRAVVAMALQTGTGDMPNFSDSERFKAEGLPLGDRVTKFNFKDLTRLGEELSQVFGMVGMLQMFMPPEVTKDPMMLTLLSAANKVGRVVRELNFYQSSCSVTTFDGRVEHTKSVTHYQEPPKPKTAPESPATEEQEPKTAQPSNGLSG